MSEKMIAAAFRDELEKLSVGPKTLLRGALSAFQRAGHKIDPSKLRWHGMEALNQKATMMEGFRPLDQKEFRENARYRLNLYQLLFPKKAPLPHTEAVRRFEIAANESLHNGFGPFDKEGPKLRKAVEERAKGKGRPIRDIRRERMIQDKLEGK